MYQIDKKRKSVSDGPKPPDTELPTGMVPFIAGIAAGMGDTIFNFPPYGLHYRKQRGKNIRPWVNPQYYRPREMFRGVVPYSFIIPVTCVTDGMSDWMKTKGLHPVFATMFAGFFAGMVISTPTSNIIIHQQMAAEREIAHAKGTPEWKKDYAKNMQDAHPGRTMQRLYMEEGIWRFTRGMPTLMMREAAYAMAVFWGKDEVMERFPALKEMGWRGFLIACTVSGIGSTLISQPMDVMTTWAIKSPRRISVAETFWQMYSEGGIARFYSGAFMRGYAIIAGIAVMDTISKWVKDRFEKK